MSSPFTLLVLTGLSGAGKSTALNVFEDLQFFSVDGLPAMLVGKLAALFKGQSDQDFTGMVLGMDTRQEDSLGDWEGALELLRSTGLNPLVIFVEARTDVLVRRYATTRRPHPWESKGFGLEQAIEAERESLAPLRRVADLVLDTSEYSIHDLRRTIQEKWTTLKDASKAMRVHVITFGFKYGVPSEADLVFDLRFLPNPYFDEKLRPLSGRDKSISDFVLAEDPGKTFLAKFQGFLDYLLPLFEKEGRYRITLAIGCTGGRHRSVSVAERVSQSLDDNGYAVSLEHRHLDLG